jgi:ribonuclease HI
MLTKNKIKRGIVRRALEQGISDPVQIGQSLREAGYESDPQWILAHIERLKRKEERLQEDEKYKQNSVFCDGCYQHRVMGIGVYSEDLGIERSERLDQPGTCNVAECLAAIAALEEIKRKAIPYVTLYSDSQLVVCWTSGAYEMRSATAKKYVPTIRRLLEEARGRLAWVPGEKNPADWYSRVKVCPISVPLCAGQP